MRNIDFFSCVMWLACHEVFWSFCFSLMFFLLQTVPTDLFSANRSCVPFFRSSPSCFAGNTQSVIGGIRQGLKRQQMNSITSFIDASSVYGSTPDLQSFIRNFSSPEGQMAINRRFYDQRGRSYLPFVHTGPSACFQDPNNPHGQERVDCFQAGDSRVNEILTLSALHTLWVREHNRIAKTLKSFNAHWSAEHIYQEARKIVGALHQVVIFLNKFTIKCTVLDKVLFLSNSCCWSSWGP